MTHLSLFTGIGGLDLAAEAAGFETVGQCEWADYPTAVLAKHWPDVPRWRDIRTLTGESFHERTGLHTVDIISGGFPCQPFSVAGKRRGKDDDRYLWPEMLRVIRELQPAWVVGENVAGIIDMALDTVLADLEGLGYACQTFIIPAGGVNAPHKRERCAIVAHANGGGHIHGQPSKQPEKTGKQALAELEQRGHSLADAKSERLSQRNRLRAQSEIRFERCCQNEFGGEMPTQSGLGRAVDGFPGWMDEVVSKWNDDSWETAVPRITTESANRAARLKCLGNAVVPEQFYPIFKAIADYIIERDYTGREYPKFKQTARCGNAVPPPFAEALVRANLPEWCS